ncbi:hypothetical protein A2U01_0028192, partial [Trifolium medium]|nr:hypothetical protein [Trifolium medium]
MNKLFSMVLQHERQDNFGSVDKSKVLVNSVDSKRSFSKGFKGSSQYFNGKGNKYCTDYCDKSGHTVEGCFKKHGYPPHMQKQYGAYNTSEGGESSTSHSEQGESYKV